MSKSNHTQMMCAGQQDEMERLADDLHSAHQEIDRVIQSNEELRAEIRELRAQLTQQNHNTRLGENVREAIEGLRGWGDAMEIGDDHPEETYTRAVFYAIAQSLRAESSMRG